MFLLVYWYEHLHPVLAMPLFEVSIKHGNLTADGPLVPLPEGLGVAVSVNYCGPLPVTPRGSTYILFFTDCFSHRADMYAVTAAEFTDEGTANIRSNRYIPLLGCPPSILSDNGNHLCSKLWHAVYKLLVVRKIATSSYHQKTMVGESV